MTNIPLVLKQMASNLKGVEVTLAYNIEEGERDLSGEALGERK